MKSLLDENLDSVPRLCRVALPAGTSGVWFDMEEFQRYLERTYDFLDIMSYGASVDSCNLPVRRAVIGLHAGRTTVKFRRKPEKVKLFTDVHAKIVIGLQKTKVLGHDCLRSSVYIGSHNFVAPTLYDLMVRLDGLKANVVLEFYESFWTTNEKKKEKTK